MDQLLSELPSELIFYLLEFITEVRNIASCMQVCSQWYDTIRILNRQYNAAFPNMDHFMHYKYFLDTEVRLNYVRRLRFCPGYEPMLKDITDRIQSDALYAFYDIINTDNCTANIYYQEDINRLYVVFNEGEVMLRYIDLGDIIVEAYIPALMPGYSNITSPLVCGKVCAWLRIGLGIYAAMDAFIDYGYYIYRR